MNKKIVTLSLLSIIATAGCNSASGSSSNSSDDSISSQNSSTLNDSSLSLLSTSGTHIVNEDGDTVQLKGFNLGGWFVLENYMSPVDANDDPLTDSYSVMETLNDRFGVTTQRELMKTYQESWIQESDIENIANAGFNVVRIPVWWGQFFDLDNPTESGFRDDAFDVLDNIINACTDNNVYVIIDMHGAIGSQSLQSHTGRADTNELWDSEDDQTMTAWLWKKIAAHYKGNNTIAAFDLLNEPDVRSDTSTSWTTADTNEVLSVYDLFYDAVREADPNRMIMIEGTFGNWNWDQLPDPDDYGWTNIVYEMHEYQWDSDGGTTTSASTIEAGIENQVEDFENHKDWNVPGYIGEFNTFQTTSSVWQYAINEFDDAGLSWSMWSYKAVNGTAPNFWGWYDPTYWPSRPDLTNDTADDIATKWQNWATTDTFELNSALGIEP
ncbi:cellulase family glycosylhydrolase [Vibrio sp. CAIM 722]|uniref:Exo-1,3-beta-glucanase D n=1 Tax=Vibrio eleionomae TaxID=2653505 RepID=A0A7X4RUW6_9VIBR|nr:glycoside hydrolase family 5 protein [Vibrio eleionomae]MZI94281.1 cellulase family glycosylhydrolase [Vibrio eleionomae]